MTLGAFPGHASQRTPLVDFVERWMSATPPPRDVLDCLPDAVLVVNARGTIVLANAQAERTFRYRRTELLGQPIALLVPPRFHAALGMQRGAFRRSANGGPSRIWPGIFLRCRNGEEILVDASISPLRHGRRRFAVVVVSDSSGRRHMEAALLHQALHDGLTGLPNRVLFIERLEQALHLARQQQQGLAVCILDLDRFKEVNDTFGHPTGDTLLREVAERLRSALREPVTIGRLGGDEYAVLLPDALDGPSALAAAGSILEALDHPFEIAGLPLQIEASLGLVLFPDHGRDAETLMRRADIAMYVAKRTGVPIALYAPEHDLHDPQRLMLLGELRYAIEHHQLVLFYQPQVDLDSGATVWAEGLVRWQHPKRGLLAPDQFIPLAEQSGLIGPLTQWVLNAALQSAALWPDQGLPCGVSINLSARNLQDPGLPHAVGAALDRWQVPPARLKVEITESSLMGDPELAQRSLTQLRALGVSIAIDDFGTGYSSLTYLKRLPVDKLKIDKSFVINMAKDNNDAAIVRSIIDLGHHFGLQVVAEGVEDQATWTSLQALGCDMAQGYYLSRPVPEFQLVRRFGRAVEG